jgi:hypothetical protein
LLENLPFFKKYKDEDQFDIIKACCKYMTYEFIPADKPVFLIGFSFFVYLKDSVGDKFYLILKGKVGIYIRK